jgi:hypothetical protein
VAVVAVLAVDVMGVVGVVDVVRGILTPTRVRNKSVATLSVASARTRNEIVTWVYSMAAITCLMRV